MKNTFLLTFVELTREGKTQVRGAILTLKAYVLCRFILAIVLSVVSRKKELVVSNACSTFAPKFVILAHVFVLKLHVLESRIQTTHSIHVTIALLQT